jgi:16S rRNA (guanine527-N7)-methyltransferase
VAYPDNPQHISQRAALAGAPVSMDRAEVLAAYLEVLRRWNQRSNLTAFELNPPTDAAIDRLIVEPVAAARRVLPGDRVLVDIGSGGGSPAIPLRLMAPQLRAVLVEARTRKAAFLREVVRQLGLDGTDVEHRRFEELAGRSELRGAVDVVTVRAVRISSDFWSNTRNVLKPGGRLLMFGTNQEFEGLKTPPNMRPMFREVLVPTNGSVLLGVERID